MTDDIKESHSNSISLDVNSMIVTVPQTSPFP